MCTFILYSPVTIAWEGGKRLSQDPEFHKMLVTRKDYEEKGMAAFQGLCDVS